MTEVQLPKFPYRLTPGVDKLDSKKEPCPTCTIPRYAGFNVTRPGSILRDPYEDKWEVCPFCKGTAYAKWDVVLNGQVLPPQPYGYVIRFHSKEEPQYSELDIQTEEGFNASRTQR